MRNFNEGNNIMKRIIAILTLVLLIMFLAGCEGSCSVRGCQGKAASGENFCPTHKADGWKVR